MADKKLMAENQSLIKIIEDIWWMARRYADGRSTYAPGMYNDAIRVARNLGIYLRLDDSQTIFARDGMGQRYSNLTTEEYNEGTPLRDYELSEINQTIQQLREENLALKGKLKGVEGGHDK